MGELPTKPLVEWLTDGARSATMPQQVLLELCEGLVRAGVPLYRVAVFVRTLHPNFMGRRFLWRAGEGVSISEAPHDILASAEMRDSPIARVMATTTRLRRRLMDPDCPDDFPILTDLRKEGIADYLVSPLIFTDGSVHIATWTTREPNGFTNEQLAGIESVVRPLARVAEIRALRRTAGNLLDTYVGHQTGARILSGHITRGDFESIEAAIWLSDMRHFTSLSDRLPPQRVLDLLNRYFDCQIPAIAEHGGEVLKFIGDGLLAIFPIEAKGEGNHAVCARALAAARAAREQVAAFDAPPEMADGGGPRFGLALHIGEVLYGNIGAGNRLDFTCIGPAVNLAARIEKLAAKLGRTVLTSGDFARECQASLAPVGRFSLSGFSHEQEVFGLKEEEGRPRQDAAGRTP